MKEIPDYYKLSDYILPAGAIWIILITQGVKAAFL